MNTRRPIWQRVSLHAVLLIGSAAFLLPYLWLLGTSWKLDKEIQRPGFHLLPQAPIPRLQSPYIDERTFEMVPPEGVGEPEWDAWIRAAVTDEIGQAIATWRSGVDAPFPLNDKVLATELVEGVFDHLKSILPQKTWKTDEAALRLAVSKATKADIIKEAFDRCYRYFALGKVLLKDRDYRIYDLTADRAVKDIWHSQRGDVTIKPVSLSNRQIVMVGYNFNSDTSFEIDGDFPLPINWHDFKRLSISFRRDQTWHALRTMIEINGTLYQSHAAKHLSTDNFWEASYQLPSPDDERLNSKHYVLLDEVDHGPAYDHGANVLRLRVEVTRSSKPAAFLAKGMENYHRIFAEVPFWRYLANSAFLVLANIIGTCLSCSLAAYAFARLRWPGRGLCFLLVLATLMIPPQVTMIPSFVIYRQLGWYNTLLPLWAPSWLGVNAFAIFLLRQAMRGIPRDLEDAARIDGCGYFRTYWHVALPLMKPALAAISIFTFLFVWNDFMGPLIYVNDQRLYPAALGLFSFLAGRENQFTLIMAASVIMALPVVIVFFFLQRFFIQGVTLSGIKG